MCSVNVECGDIIFTSDWGFLGTLVRLNSGKHIFKPAIVGHCGIMETGNIMVESAGNGVERVSFSEVLKRKTHIYLGKLNQRSKNALKANIYEFNNFIRNNIGKPYDIKQVIQFFVSRNTGLWNTKEDFTRLFCSEMVTGCLESAGIIEPTNASIKSPQDIFEYGIYENIVRIK